MLAERQRPVRIAVVGHTNTGKTSLLRTLTRDAGFGEVSSRPSTTRHVEGARLRADGAVVVELFDTPGMEDPIALLELIEGFADDGAGGRRDGPDRVACFLAHASARARFEQEAKVLRQLLASDAGLYVVDVRDPVLAKHRDELAVLACCARPLLPVLNFVGSPQTRESTWREALARLGLHAMVRFDTVAPERDGERLLYATLGTLLDARRGDFERLIADRAREHAARRHAALTLVADLLVDAAAYRATVADATEDRVAAHVAELNKRVSAREQQCVAALLELYRFGGTALEDEQLPVVQGRWDDDLFHPETLRVAGVQVGSGAAAGAAAGMGVDLLVGGMTLGAAAALGALAGGGLQAVRHLGGRVLGRLSGRRDLTVADEVLALLAVRQLYLVSALERRGHAALVPIRRFVTELGAEVGVLLSQCLATARGYPHWSGIDAPFQPDPARDGCVERAVDWLATALPDEALPVGPASKYP